MERIDARMQPADQANITTGAAVAGMILQGLGCADRPLSVPPQFCATKPVALRCRAGVAAEPCHLGTLGRSLDQGVA